MRLLSPIVVFLIVLLVGTTSVSASGMVDINRSGRRIQVDGFLIDWNEQNRRAWSGSNAWYWDAINTPEGVAGYFHGTGVQCSSWTFFADARHFASRPRKMTVCGADTAKSDFFSGLATPDGSRFAVTVEWVVPWDSVAVDSSGTYALHLVGNSACGDTLQPLLVTGSVSSLKKQNRLPPRFAERILLIIVFLVIFIVLQAKVRKKGLRTGSIRR
jgi:hypothetical protein